VELRAVHPEDRGIIKVEKGPKKTCESIKLLGRRGHRGKQGRVRKTQDTKLFEGVEERGETAAGAAAEVESNRAIRTL